MPREELSSPWLVYGLLLMLASGVVWRVLAPAAAPAAHPDPRAGVTAINGRFG